MGGYSNAKVPPNFEKPPLFHSGYRETSGLAVTSGASIRMPGLVSGDYKILKTENEPIFDGEGQLPNFKRPKLVEEGRLSQMLPQGQCHIPTMSSCVGQMSMLSRQSQGMGDVLMTTAGQNSVHASHFNPLNEPSPLGLMLRKSPSLLDLLQRKLAPSEDVDSQCSDDMNQDFLVSRVGTGPLYGTEKDKLKAANFLASTLRIGSWERVSRYDGDLVAKCYYAKRKLVWEVLDSGLKSKMEIQWSDISALKAKFPEGQPAILDLEVSRPPLFFREINPQPRKHTLWQSTSDFTDGQATNCRHHSVQFPDAVLNRHFEKLLQCDARLKALNEQTGAITDSYFFENRSMHMDRQQILHYQTVFSDHGVPHPRPIEGLKNEPLQHAAPADGTIEGIQGHLLVEKQKNEPLQNSTVHSNIESNQCHLTIEQLKTEPLQHAAPVQSDLTYVAPLTGILRPQRGLQMQLSDVTSPSSVIDARGSDESSSSSETEEMHGTPGKPHDEKMHSNVSLVNSMPLPIFMTGSWKQMNEWASSLSLESSMKWEVDDTGSCQSIEASEKQVLNELSLQLLGEPISSTEQYAYLLGPVNATQSSSACTEDTCEDLTNINTPVITADSSCSFLDTGRDMFHTRDGQLESYHHDLLTVEECKVYPRFGETYRNPMPENQTTSSFETATPRLASHGSCIDLLYLPRIASVPQFFEPAP